ncbi:TPA_asm: P7 [Passiflora betacytorhabdovirus 1]|nr:TPA_asm: P7 [Passiflora betacytorhabdovirus 1]
MDLWKSMSFMCESSSDNDRETFQTVMIIIILLFIKLYFGLFLIKWMIKRILKWLFAKRSSKIISKNGSHHLV